MHEKINLIILYLSWKHYLKQSSDIYVIQMSLRNDKWFISLIKKPKGVYTILLNFEKPVYSEKIEVYIEKIELRFKVLQHIWV